MRERNSCSNVASSSNRLDYICLSSPLPSSPHPLARPVMLGHAGRWLCPQGETAITVPIDGRHNARGLDSREFSTARQSIWPRRASGRAGWRGWVGEKEEEICRDRKAAIELIRLMSASSIVCMFSECAPPHIRRLSPACLPACLPALDVVFWFSKATSCSLK